MEFTIDTASRAPIYRQLARQIREGAPAQLFLSASQQWMDYLVRETDRVRSASRLDLLANRLVLVVPPDNPGDIESVADLSEPFDGLALGDPEHVPAGIYAAAWLREAEQKEVNDPTAVALATVGEDGMPSCRMVLLKGQDARGFVFYTNYESRKGRQLLASAKAAMLFGQDERADGRCRGQGGTRQRAFPVAFRRPLG